MSNDYNDTSIQIGPGYKTGTKGLFFNDKLEAADVKHYAYVHAAGAEKGRYSSIGMLILDYSEKGNTKQAKVNLSPAQVKMMYAAAFTGKESFDLEIEKIYGAPQADGRMFMDKARIKRATVGSKGEERKLPWYIEVDNGTAMPGKTASGGTYQQSGTFKSNVKLYINLSDKDFFDVISRVFSYLTAWEISTGTALIAMKEEQG